MMSVRRRLLLGTGAATIVIFLAAALSLYFLSRHFLIKEFDESLRSKARAIFYMTDLADSGAHLETDDARALPEFQPGKDPQYFEILSDEGDRIASSPSLGDRRINYGTENGRPAVGARSVELPDGRRGRAVTIRAKALYEPEEEEVARVQASVRIYISITVAKATQELDRLLARLRTLLVAVTGTATIVMLGIAAWVIQRGLRPVNRLARNIAGIDANDLTERLGPEVPKELSPIVSRLNELLARLEAAFEREKSFTSDAAHELRTPLAGLEAALEVCARQRRQPERYEQVVRDCLKVVRQMHAMIDNLLMLARADAGRVPIMRAPVDVGELLRESWTAFQPVADQRRLNVQVDVAEHLVCDTDAAKLSIIFNNLLENAVHYADESGSVQITAGNSDHSVKVAIANSGSRVRPEDVQRMFDRFWRGDAARSSGGQHAGLGLAVCRKLATVLGASLSARCAPEDLFIVQLELRAGPA